MLARNRADLAGITHVVPSLRSRALLPNLTSHLTRREERGVACLVNERGTSGGEAQGQHQRVSTIPSAYAAVQCMAYFPQGFLMRTCAQGLVTAI